MLLRIAGSGCGEVMPSGDSRRNAIGRAADHDTLHCRNIEPLKEMCLKNTVCAILNCI